MSVLKAHRSESKAEFVNTANKIYVETINLLITTFCKIFKTDGKRCITSRVRSSRECRKGKQYLPIGSYQKGIAQAAPFRVKSCIDGFGC